MVKPCFGACIGFVGGLFIGWIIQTFVIDPSAIDGIFGGANMSIILIAGVVGLIIGVAITYVTQKDEEESVFS
jgi:uncharacterized membrane-anchored protein YhcB (DUF1043 family)